MEKSRILISCNARTLVLAGKLRDELHKGDCETALWIDDARSQSSAALLELLAVGAVVLAVTINLIAGLSSRI